MTAVNTIQDFHSALSHPGVTSLPQAILHLDAAEDDERNISRALHTMLYGSTVLKSFDGPKDFHFKDVQRLYVEALSRESHAYVIESLSYLSLYSAIAQYIKTDAMNVRKERWFESRLPRYSEDLIATVEGIEGFDSTLTSSQLVLGKLHALHDRRAAAAMFNAATRDSAQSMGIFQHDCGAVTYFEDLNGLSVKDDDLPQHRYDTDRVLNVSNGRFLVVMSCEERYFRMYLPYWLSIAHYLQAKGFSYHFILIDANGEAERLFTDAENLLQAMAQFRGYRSDEYCQNVSFSYVSLPSWCPTAASFAACARLLYSREIAERTGSRVISQDVDLCLKEDPTAWFEALPADKLALASNRASLTIDPWRKFLAGTVVLPNDVPAFAAAREIEQYIAAGLKTRNSWYLDQNALAYVYDSHDGAHGDLLFSLADLYPLARPSHSHRIHYMIKRLQPAVPTASEANRP